MKLLNMIFNDMHSNGAWHTIIVSNSIFEYIIKKYYEDLIEP